jgi:electron transport complex protein RnfC
VHGEALTERIVTVTGSGVRRPGNFLVRLGTPVAHLIDTAGGYTDAAARLIMGGPMMGIALPHDDIPLVKAGNCVLVLGADDVRERAPELPCIRCGECAQACPAQLLPQQLLHQIKGGEFDTARQHGLLDCIECGLCAFVCPSQIPLVDWYRFGKSELSARRDERARADHARERYRAREVRLALNAAERVARVSARAQDDAAAPLVSDPEAQSIAAQAPAAESTTTSAPAATPMDKAAVLAAIARGRARKHTPPRDDSGQDT